MSDSDEIKTSALNTIADDIAASAADIRIAVGAAADRAQYVEAKARGETYGGRNPGT